MSLCVSLSGQLGSSLALDISFDLPESGITCLLGPSGSGKTTILRAVAGLQRLAGSVTFGGEIWQDERLFLPAHKRSVGYVFQGGSLLPHLTVKQNLAYASRRAPPGPFGYDDVIARSGIAALLDRQPARLSGGETQRASIARALLCQPRLLLMDEPLSALDGEAKAELLTHFEVLLREISIPVVYVTHDEMEAHRLALRTVRIRNGSVDAQARSPAVRLEEGSRPAAGTERPCAGQYR